MVRLVFLEAALAGATVPETPTATKAYAAAAAAMRLNDAFVILSPCVLLCAKGGAFPSGIALGLFQT
jgi:hypothetical protein